MYTLLDFKDKNLADYLNSALRRHGLDSYVFPSGLGPDGEEIFTISCLQPSELKQGDGNPYIRSAYDDMPFLIALIQCLSLESLPPHEDT